MYVQHELSWMTRTGHPPEDMEQTALTETEQQLATLLARIVPLPADFDAQSDLIDGLAMESMQVMEFVMEAEDHFDVAIAQDKLADVRNIAQLAVIIEQL